MSFQINIYTDSTHTKAISMRCNDVFAAIDYAKQNLVNVNQYAIILHAHQVIAVVLSEAEPMPIEYECPEIRDIKDAFDEFMFESMRGREYTYPEFINQSGEIE